MKLAPQEFKRLHQALVAIYGTRDNLQLMLRIHTGRRLDDLVGDKPMPAVVLEVIGAAEQEGWLGALIQGALDDHPDHPALQPLADWFAGWQAAQPPDPFQVRFMYDREPLLGRDDMRRHIEALCDPHTGVRIVTVHGQPVSGKTFTAHYIGYLKTHVGGFEWAFVDLRDLRRRLGEGVGPEDVGRSIAAQLGLDTATMPRVEREQEARWNHFFCDWLTGEMRRRNDELDRPLLYWIIIDECSDHMRKGIADLVHELAQRVAFTLDVVRLVLLHHPGTDLPVHLIANIRAEAIRAIGRTEVEDFFECILTRVRARLGLSDTAYREEVTRSVDRVMSRVDAADPRRLEQLSRAAGAEALALIQA